MIEDFMCRCSKNEIKRCDRYLAEARKHIEDYAGTITDVQFIDSMLYNLSGDGDLKLMSDQWGGINYELFGINPETHRYDTSLSQHFSTQCDSFIDGLARIYMWKVENGDSSPGTEVSRDTTDN